MRLYLLFLFTSAYGCNVPSEFWCDNKQIAELCQVTDQCEKNVWSVESKPVQLTLFYESLCPDCKNFFEGQLDVAMDKISSIFTLQLVPYGNAMEEKDGTKWKFTCQHGTEECTGNLIETCAIHLFKNMSTLYPFVYCMESSNDSPQNAASKCAEELSIDLTPITDCASSDMGNKLEHEMAVQTNNLNPPHTYVPWILLNGVHTEKIQEKAQTNLVRLICDTYKGQKPAACSSQQMQKTTKSTLLHFLQKSMDIL